MLSNIIFRYTVLWSYWI